MLESDYAAQTLLNESQIVRVGVENGLTILLKVHSSRKVSTVETRQIYNLPPLFKQKLTISLMVLILKLCTGDGQMLNL